MLLLRKKSLASELCYILKSINDLQEGKTSFLNLCFHISVCKNEIRKKKKKKKKMGHNIFYISALLLRFH